MEFGFTKRCLEKAFERKVIPEDWTGIFEQAEVIESIPDNKPFPSEIRLAKVGETYLHFVCIPDESFIHILSVYKPDPTRWFPPNFKKRKK